jgi:hypothetical protein
MVIRTGGVVSGNVSATTWSNSDETNFFSIWVSTIRFLFFKFNLEINIVDFFSSSDNRVTSIMGLTLGVDYWNSIEVFLESNTYEIFHNVFD